MNIDSFTRWSSLPRMVDPRIRNHQFMLALSGAGGLIGFIYAWLINHRSFAESVLRAAILLVSVFLTWAISRELDPDHPPSALVGPILIIPALLPLGSPSLLLGFVMITLFRVVTRCTGLSARPLDSLALVLMAGWMAYSLHPIIGLLVGVGLLADSRLPGGHPYHGYLGVGVILTAAAYWLLQGPGLQMPSWIWLLAAGAASLLYLIAVARQQPATAPTDFTDRAISSLRVKTAQVLALLAALAPMFVMAEQGLLVQLPLWASLIGVTAFTFVRQAAN